jgi:hypothetical protein
LFSEICDYWNIYINTFILNAGVDWQKFEDSCVNDNSIIEDRTFEFAEQMIREGNTKL